MLAAQDAALVQAARKEGKVVWYTSLALPSSTAIAHFFEQKYKGITVEVHRTGSQRVLQRVMQEATAGIKNGDIIHTSDAGHFELLKAKNLLLKYTPQGVGPFPDGFKDKAGFYYGMRATLSVRRMRRRPGRICSIQNGTAKRSPPIPVIAALS
jgi:iron(III) transport system substrate-binding protein